MKSPPLPACQVPGGCLEWPALKTFFKWLGVALAVLILLVLAALATLGWWLPPLAESQASEILEDLGFEAVEMEVERFGYSGVTITGLALERAEADVALRSVLLDYSLTGLLVRRQAESLIIDGLDVTVYVQAVLEDWQFGGAFIEEQDEEDGPTSEPLALPEDLSLPVKNLLLDDSSLTLEADGWRKRLNVNAYLEDGRPARYLLEADDAADLIDVSGTIDTISLENETTFHLRMARPTEWQGLLDSLKLNTLPEGLDWESGAFELEGALRTDDAELGSWTVLGSLNNFAAETADGSARLGLFNFGASGDGMMPDKLWAGLFNGEARLANPLPARFEWEAATLETLDSERVYLKLEDWELSGDLAMYKLGDVSATAGPVRVLLDGPWATVRGAEDLQPFSVRLILQEGPVEIFTGKGSILGTLGLRADFGPVKGEPQLEAAATLTNGTINAGPVEIATERVKVAVGGKPPNALASTIYIKNTDVTWASDSGHLTGINGEVQIANILPLAMPEKQTLTFKQLEQGKIVIYDGEINVAYQAATESEQAEVSLTAGGDFANGGIAGRIQVTLGEPFTAQADLLLQRVSLTYLAGLFPKFDGKIQGYVSGEIPIKKVGNRVFIRPGYLEMAAGDTGKFSYTKQGWLTQDPSLNPVEFSKDMDLATLMKQPKGGAILTELAMRDLNMSAFRLDILKPGEGKERISIHLEGDGSFKGVKVPIVLDVPIRGDVKELINLMLLMNEKLEFGQ